MHKYKTLITLVSQQVQWYLIMFSIAVKTAGTAAEMGPTQSYRGCREDVPSSHQTGADAAAMKSRCLLFIAPCELFTSAVIQIKFFFAVIQTASVEITKAFC